MCSDSLFFSPRDDQHIVVEAQLDVLLVDARELSRDVDLLVTLDDIHARAEGTLQILDQKGDRPKPRPKKSSNSRSTRRKVSRA